MDSPKSTALVSISTLALVALLTGCDGDIPTAAPPSPSSSVLRAAQPPTAAELESDRHMALELRGIYERADAENSFLGDRDERELAASLAALPADAPPELRWVSSRDWALPSFGWEKSIR